MYTRQNGGLSATTGKRLPTQTVVPLTIDTGSSCPGPQVIDPYDDASSSILIGAGSNNVDTMDIGSVRFTTPDGTHVQVAMTLKNLSSLPATGTASSLWDVFWQYSGTTYYVAATTNGPGLQTYDAGTFTDNFNSRGDVPGTFVEGPNGTITWTVTRSMIDLPDNAPATITKPYADDHGAFSVLGNGLRYVAAVDRAPDVGNGVDYAIGGAC